MAAVAVWLHVHRKSNEVSPKARYDERNRARLALIHKKRWAHPGLTENDGIELEVLTEACNEYLARFCPRPPLPKE